MLDNGWREGGFGFLLLESKVCLTHAIWSDNLFLFSASWSDMQTMLGEITIAIKQRGWTWKLESLQFMSCGSLAGPSENLPAALQAGGFAWKSVPEIEALGMVFNPRACSKMAFDHRGRTAEKLYWKNCAAFKGGRNHQLKLKAWTISPQSSAAFGLGVLHWDADLLHHVVVWEVRLLRRVLNLRPKSSEELQIFRSRSRTLHRGVVSEDVAENAASSDSVSGFRYCDQA